MLSFSVLTYHASSLFGTIPYPPVWEPALRSWEKPYIGYAAIDIATMTSLHPVSFLF